MGNIPPRMPFYFRMDSPTNASHAYRGSGQSTTVSPAQLSQQHAAAHRGGGATVDALTGRVLSLQRSKIRVKASVDFYQRITEVYANRETIYIVQDNWPIHLHPDVLAALRPQQLKWPVHVPSN